MTTTTTTRTWWCSKECRTYRNSREKMNVAKNQQSIEGAPISYLKVVAFHLRWDRAARAEQGRCQGCGCWPKDA